MICFFKVQNESECYFSMRKFSGNVCYSRHICVRKTSPLTYNERGVRLYASIIYICVKRVICVYHEFFTFFLTTRIQIAPYHIKFLFWYAFMSTELDYVNYLCKLLPSNLVCPSV